MTRILSVDDSRAIRSMIAKQVKELGFEVDEAEDGQQGLARLEECVYDLVLLDVTMPVLDGPGMLEKMREAGNKTPVLMLTSESKRSIVASVMKQGIEDYVLKPFKPEELRAKILKTLKLTEPPPPPAAVATDADDDEDDVPKAAPAPRPAATSDVAAGRQFIDILVVDDMENVQKKIRTMLPAHITLNAASNARAARGLCRERVFRVILVDYDIPDVDSSTLVTQMRSLQPHAAFVALCLRTSNAAEEEAGQHGFDSVLYKPFDPSSIEDFLLQYFDNQDLVTIEDNQMRVSAFTGKADRLDRYFQRVGFLIDRAIEGIAAACFDDVIIDIGHMPARVEKIPRMIVSLSKKSADMGLTLRLVGTAETRAVLRQFADTSSVPFFESVQQAKAA